MGLRMIGLGIALTVAGGLAGCAPGPGGYAGWSNYREHQASAHASAAHRDAQDARWQAERGNYWGAQQSQAAANAEAARARQEHEHAAKDRWLSQF